MTPTKTSEPQPQSQTASPQETIEAVQAMPEDTVDKVVSLPKSKKGAFHHYNHAKSSVIENKAKLIADVKAKLKEAAELDKEAAAIGGGQSGEEGKATEVAQDAAKMLYSGLTSGVFNNDEVSEYLGTAFGWKAKKDGKQSKTPARLGEAIRKRVVRAVKAHEYAVQGASPVAFFEPLERDNVSQMLHELDNGNRSIWTLYDDLGKAKAEATGQRPTAAFDPRRISALTRDIGTNIAETVKIVQRTPGLFAAYAGMLQMLETIENELPVDEANAAQAA